MCPDYRKVLDLDSDQCRILVGRAMNHDVSKFSPIQFDAYVEFTWMMQLKRQGEDVSWWTELMQARFDNAWKDHFRKEQHHPETGKIAGVMTKLDHIEVSCDLKAMAQEFCELSGRKYFVEKWIPKHQDVYPVVGMFEKACKVIEQCFDCFEKEDRVMDCMNSALIQESK